MTSSFGNYEIMSLNHYINDMFKEYTIETKSQSYSPVVFIARRIFRDTTLLNDYMSIFKLHFRIVDANSMRKITILNAPNILKTSEPRMYFAKLLR